MDRRAVLTVGGSLAVATTLAGCSGIEQNESADQTDAEADSEPNDESMTAENESASESDDDEPTTTENETESADDDALDLREANVVGVTVDDSGSATDFAVELHHDDDGEEGYADWWQVETLDGTQLGRRELRHPHSRQPFTRSAGIEVPDDVTCVVVRGHDQTHGYGGRVVVVNLDAGEQNAIRQGSERQVISKSVNRDSPSENRMI